MTQSSMDSDAADSSDPRAVLGALDRERERARVTSAGSTTLRTD